MGRESKIHLAVLSGTFATGGGVCAKLAGLYEFADMWSLTIKLTLLIAMVASNTLGCTLFVKALASSGSSLPATVTSSAVNFFCSALVGLLFFGESTTLRWWFGTSLVLLGLLLICYSPPAASASSDSSKKKQQQQQQQQKKKEE